MSTAPPPPEYQHDPRAAAKAAKAYAKATRPWFKKKRFIVPIALVALIGFSMALSGGDESAPAATDNAESSDVESAAEEAPAPGDGESPAPVGTPVENKSARYIVHGVETTTTAGPAFAEETAAGVFVVVDLSVENVKDETIQFSTHDLTLQVDGTEIDADSVTFMLDDGFVFDDISPGLTKRGKVAFDVSPDATGTGVLKAQAIFSTDKPVYLSLQ